MLQRKAVLLGSVVLLTLVLALGCSLLPRENVAEGDGWYIKLRIQAPPAAKGITVGEFDVTGLHIEVWGLDQEEPLASFDWAEAEGFQEYSVPVPQLGEYRIVVTHLGGSEEAPVQATEEAVFEIRAMKITVIDVVPGGIGAIQVEGEVSIDVTGYWDLFLIPGPPQPGPLWVCMKQDGTHLDAIVSDGFFVGAIEGDHLTMQGDPGGGFDIVLDGTVSGDQIAGTVAWPGSEDEGMFTMTRSTLPFGHWDLTGFYQEEELPLFLDTEYGIGALGDPDDPPPHFFLWYEDTQLSAQLWINVVGEDLVAGRDYAFPNEAWGSLHWSYHTEEFDRDIELTSPGTLHIYSYSAEGIAGEYSAGLQGGGSISGKFSVSFVEGFD